MVSFAVTHFILRDPTGQGLNGPTSGFKEIVRWFLKGLGYYLIFQSNASVKLSILLLIGSGFYFILLSKIEKFVVYLLNKLYPNRGIAKMKYRYLAHEFLTEEEYNMNSKKHTAEESQKLFQNPKFQLWMLNNMDRINLSQK